MPSLKKFLTQDAGYALAHRIDFELHVLGSGLQGGTLDTSPGNPSDAVHTIAYDAAVIGGDGSTTWDSTANTNTGNGTQLSDEGIRTMIQLLDDVDCPFEDRAWVIPPVTRKEIMGLPRFSEQAFVGDGNMIRNGVIGNIYGVPVYVSSACPRIQATDASTNYRVGMLLHESALALAPVWKIRSQMQYKLEYLGTLYTADTFFGVGELRDDHGVAFVVPA